MFEVLLGTLSRGVKDGVNYIYVKLASQFLTAVHVGSDCRQQRLVIIGPFLLKDQLSIKGMRTVEMLLRVLCLRGNLPPLTKSKLQSMTVQKDFNAANDRKEKAEKHKRRKTSNPADYFGLCSTSKLFFHLLFRFISPAVIWYCLLTMSCFKAFGCNGRGD